MEWTKKKPVGGSKYGLQLKIVAPATKKPQLKKPLPFSPDGGDDQDEYSVEDDIARHASKKQAAHEVDVQIKQALAQDSNVFDYDGVYDEMKGQQARPILQDRAKREVKYIGKLLDKAKVRAVEHDIAYERKLAKEREKEDHLFGDKEKFVTNAYKKKLVEQGKWQEEERLRELREKEHEVSGKRNLGDFYRNLLSNNVAFGARDTEQEKLNSVIDGKNQVEADKLSPDTDLGTSSTALRGGKEPYNDDDDLDEQGNTAYRSRRSNEDDFEAKPASGSSSGKQHLEELKGETEEEKTGTVVGSLTNTKTSARAQGNSTDSSAKKDGLMSGKSVGATRSREESVAAAKERYLARKKQRND